MSSIEHYPRTKQSNQHGIEQRERDRDLQVQQSNISAWAVEMKTNSLFVPNQAKKHKENNGLCIPSRNQHICPKNLGAFNSSRGPGKKSPSKCDDNIQGAGTAKCSTHGVHAPRFRGWLFLCLFLKQNLLGRTTNNSDIFGYPSRIQKCWKENSHKVWLPAGNQETTTSCSSPLICPEHLGFFLQS